MIRKFDLNAKKPPKTGGFRVSLDLYQELVEPLVCWNRMSL